MPTETTPKLTEAQRAVLEIYANHARPSDYITVRVSTGNPRDFVVTWIAGAHAYSRVYGETLRLFGTAEGARALYAAERAAA